MRTLTRSRAAWWAASKAPATTPDSLVIDWDRVRGLVMSAPLRPKTWLVTMVGRDVSSTIKIRKNRQMQMRILYSVCRSDQAAESTAPQGPPAAVPAAISETALPPSTPAFTRAAEELATPAAVPEAADFTPSFPSSLAALAKFRAASPHWSPPSPNCSLSGSDIRLHPLSTYLLFLSVCYNQGTVRFILEMVLRLSGFMSLCGGS